MFGESRTGLGLVGRSEPEIHAQWALLQRPDEHRPPLQSESDPQAPHLLFEHLPILQSESEPQAPHLPLEHLPLPLQSESEPQAPHLPPEHLPYPAQSESEPHELPAYELCTRTPNAARKRTAANVVIRRVMVSPCLRSACERAPAPVDAREID